MKLWVHFGEKLPRLLSRRWLDCAQRQFIFAIDLWDTRGIDLFYCAPCGEIISKILLYGDFSCRNNLRSEPD